MRTFITIVTVVVVGVVGVMAQNDAASDDPYAETGWVNAVDTGEALYGAMCASCHGVDGSGDFGPALDENPSLTSDSYVVLRIVQGGGGMPRLGPPQLDDEQVTLVVNYVRNAWSNGHGEVDVDTVREHIATHSGASD
jgi:mono/diheme cytochrome c family protein